MKIYEHQGVIFNQTDKSNKKNISEKNSFQSVMDQVTSSSVNKENNVHAGTQMPFANGVGLVIEEKSIIENKEDVLTNLKDTLYLVDFYAEKLANSSISSDNLFPLVEQLEERLSILKEMESSVDMNDKLKTIISEVTTMMGTEIERYRRGDYL